LLRKEISELVNQANSLQTTALATINQKKDQVDKKEKLAIKYKDKLKEDMMKNRSGKDNFSSPTLQEINIKYQNDKQKEEIINLSEEKNNPTQAEKFLKKLIEAEIYGERKRPNPQLRVELLQLKEDCPNIYRLLNKEGRVDK
ncbi:5907_t:CDS:2, partial [Cetraspora pellucida]